MTNSIFIYHFLASTEIGGAPINVKNLIKKLDKKKFKNFCLSFTNSEFKPFNKDCLIETPHIKKIFSYSTFVIFFLIKNIFNRKKIIISTHGRGTGFIVRIIAIFFKFKIIHTYRGFEKNFGIQNVNLLKKISIKILTFIEKEISKRSFNICVSKSELKEVNSILNIKKNIKLIYNPVQIKFTKKKIKKTIDFLIIGRKSYQKGFDIYLNIIKNNPDLKITWLGNSQQNEFNDLNTEKFKNKLISATNSKKILRETKFLLILSRWEGASTVCIEALKTGIPVITLSCRGVDEFIKFTKGGIIINNKKKLVKILKKFSNISVYDYNKLKKNTKKIFQLINIKKIVKEYENLYLHINDNIK